MEKCVMARQIRRGYPTCSGYAIMCNPHNCKFYKSEAQAEEERKRNVRRILSLEPKQRDYLVNKYRIDTNI